MQKFGTVLIAFFLAACGWAQVQLPQGKGIWFYVLPATGNPVKVAKGVKSAGFDYVLLKVHEGSRMYEPNIGYFDRFAREFHTQGVKVYAWGFNYARSAGVDTEGFPTGYEQEGKLIGQLLDGPTFDGYVFNWELNATSQAAKKRVYDMVKAVVSHRDRTKGIEAKPIGWSTHGLYLRHRGLPASEFLKAGIDFIQPQIYWKEWRMDPKAAVETSYAQWRQVISTRPVAIIPTGQTYIGHWGKGPVNGEATAFVQACLAKGATAIDFWRYPQGQADKARMPNYDDVLKEVNEAMASMPNPTGVQVEGPSYGFWWSLFHSPVSYWQWLTTAYWQGVLLLLIVGLTTLVILYPAEYDFKKSYWGLVVVAAFAWTCLLWLLTFTALLAVFALVLLILRKYILQWRRRATA